MMSYRMEIVEDKDEGGIAAAMGSTMPTTANPTAQGNDLCDIFRSKCI